MTNENTAAQNYTQTAANQYAAREAEIRTDLGLLSALLKLHSKEASKEGAHFGHVGELGHIHNELREIIGFLLGVDETEIEATMNARAASGPRLQGFDRAGKPTTMTIPDRD